MDKHDQHPLVSNFIHILTIRISKSASSLTRRIKKKRKDGRYDSLADDLTAECSFQVLAGQWYLVQLVFGKHVVCAMDF